MCLLSLAKKKKKKAIEVAQLILKHFIQGMSHYEESIGVSFHFHSMAAFAVVLLLKPSSRCRHIGINIELRLQSWPLNTRIIVLLRSYPAGKAHMAYKLTAGFERNACTVEEDRASPPPIPGLGLRNQVDLMIGLGHWTSIVTYWDRDKLCGRLLAIGIQ